MPAGIWPARTRRRRRTWGEGGELVAVKAELSRGEARRLALTAQGFAVPRPKKVTAKHLLGVVDTLGGVQVDAVNVMARAHLFTFFSRLGPYDEALLHKLWEPGGGLIEYWMHGTSLMRYDTWPQFAWRMRQKP